MNRARPRPPGSARPQPHLRPPGPQQTPPPRRGASGPAGPLATRPGGGRWPATPQALTGQRQRAAGVGLPQGAAAAGAARGTPALPHHLPAPAAGRGRARARRRHRCHRRRPRGAGGGRRRRRARRGAGRMRPPAPPIGRRRANGTRAAGATSPPPPPRRVTRQPPPPRPDSSRRGQQAPPTEGVATPPERQVRLRLRSAAAAGRSSPPAPALLAWSEPLPRATARPTCSHRRPKGGTGPPRLLRRPRTRHVTGESGTRRRRGGACGVGRGPCR